MSLCGQAFAIDVDSTMAALRLSGSITGGTIPPSDPNFAQMVTSIQSGDYYGAALIAAKTNYFAQYLGRRLAKEMMSPALTATAMTDNDATAFIVSHFAGSTAAPSISTLWSDNTTYLVNVTVNGTVEQMHMASLSTAQLAAVNYLTDIVAVPGQSAKNSANTVVPIPAKHVGGYATLSDRQNDNSLAMYGLTAGTNLRFIEAIWEISMGYTLSDMASTEAQVQEVPKFVPENNPNMFVGQGQPACISCHGGGASSLNHGYSAVADIFDYNANTGFTYIATPTTGTMKSLGSNSGNRSSTQTCNMSTFTTCNPDSLGADPNQSWNVATTWGESGLLAQMGWPEGMTSGQGLNALGAAIGKAALVYTNMVNRVVNEVCPLGSIAADRLQQIAQIGQTTDDIRQVVAQVASDPSCR